MISLAASAERCASARTSEATTAKPLPASPARAASTRGVQRQQVGLEGDLVDHADDLRDLIRRISRCRPSPATASRTIAVGLLGFGLDLGRRLRLAWRAPLGRLPHGGGEFVQRRRRLLDGGRLLLGAPGEIVGRLADLDRAPAFMLSVLVAICRIVSCELAQSTR